MISRRTFMQAGTVGSAALVSPMLAVAEKLPRSIAGLKSMKDQAQPIALQEREQRQEKARRLMAANALDAILLMEGTSLEYFTGVRWHGGERMFAMILPARGESFYVCPGFEEGRAREQLANSPNGEHADVRIWQEDESPYELVAQGLRDRGMATGKLGIEETVRFVFSQGVAKSSPQTQTTSATPVTAGCRGIKSEHEIALMRLASKVTLLAYEAAYHALRPGMTKPQFEDLVTLAHERLGYTSDITRTFVLGKAGDKMKRVFEIVHEAQSAAVKAARPGLECEAVDAAARKVITDAGYGPDYKYFTHRLGHGMGMDGHEWPYLVRGNSRKLEPHMTFSDEPGIYIRGEFGIRLEDDMHITEFGAELFTSQSASLEEPFRR